VYERMHVGVGIKELDALLDAGIVRIVPEFDGKVMATSTYTREDIMRFLLEKSWEQKPEPAEEKSTDTTHAGEGKRTLV
jgi:hypothetical protein